MNVMAGLDPAIHVFVAKKEKTWIRGSSPRMTKVRGRGLTQNLARNGEYVQACYGLGRMAAGEFVERIESSVC